MSNDPNHPRNSGNKHNHGGGANNRGSGNNNNTTNNNNRGGGGGGRWRHQEYNHSNQQQYPSYQQQQYQQQTHHYQQQFYQPYQQPNHHYQQQQQQHHHQQQQQQQQQLSRGNNRNKKNNHPDRSHLPLEQGVICTLKDSFGFIHCADRPDEVFFHFTNLMGIQAAALQLNDEVEFRVGPSTASNNSNNNRNESPSNGLGGPSQSAEQKMAAFEVRRLQPGTIVWEHEEEPGRRFRGLVERTVRTDRTGNVTADGSIRMLVDKEEQQRQDPSTPQLLNEAETTPQDQQQQQWDQWEQVEKDAQASVLAEGPLVRFTVYDYQPMMSYDASVDAAAPGDVSIQGAGSNNWGRRPPNRLSRGDFVEFSLVVDRRTKERYARAIVLLVSERERVRQQQEIRLLSEASVEHGVVTALKGEYGFLKSNKRKGEVYFHYSNVEMDGEEGHDMVLEEGQDMKFLVVTEKSGDAGQRERVSARRVKMQPRGSVKFHDVIATGMTGMVIICPQPVDSGHAEDQKGKIRLSRPITYKDEGDGSVKTVTEVFLRSRDSPGGNFSFRGGSSVGLWIQEGDTLLFDVIRELVDDTCRAVATKYLYPRECPTDLTNDQDVNEENPGSLNRAVRLVSLHLASRAEGIVNAVKENYGFLHFVERPVDAHFKLFQMLPDELQADLRRNLGIPHVDSEGRPLQLEVGAEVQFDLSVHGTIHHPTAPTRHHHRGGGGATNTSARESTVHERENLKAQRLLLLPPGSIQQTVVLAEGIQGTVTKEDTKQPYAGTVDLEKPISSMSLEERHPLVAQMVDTFLADEQETTLVFHDIQSQKEDDVVIDMIEARGKGLITYSFVPQANEPHYSGRLVLHKVSAAADAGDTAQPLPGEQVEGGATATGESTDSSDTHHPSTGSARAAAGESGTTTTTASEQPDKSDAEKGEKQHKHKKKHAKSKIVKSLRYEKPSLIMELREEIPPAVDDKMIFDVVQSRRTGQVSVENMRFLERHVTEMKPAAAVVTGVGIVKDIIAARNFGFIAVQDEGGTLAKNERLFFNLNNVESSGGGHDGQQHGKKVQKGDEVKFTIGTEKNGKRVALNITILPRGTLVVPDKQQKQQQQQQLEQTNACKGLVLLEPSHTTLKHAPLRHASSNASQGSDKSSGRWDGVEEDRKRLSGTEEQEPVTEQGCIILLKDPSGMFNNNNNSKRGRSKSPTPPSISKGNDDKARKHLRYKNTAVAAGTTDELLYPKRGDMVTFVGGGKGGIRDIRVVTRGASTFVAGRLEEINVKAGHAKFVTDRQDTYEVDLAEVVSCDPSVVKEKEQVEGILHEGRIYGICRNVDLYLESKVAGGAAHNQNRQRPKLNLTVRKDRGGTIMAQSMMAKGPDGTNGFASGWTTRTSRYTTHATPDPTPETSAPATTASSS